MAFQPVPNTLEVLVRGAINGQRSENGFYYRYDTPPDATSLQVLAAAVSSVVLSDWLPLLPPGWVGREVYARDLASEAAEQATVTAIAGAQGTAAGETLPEFNTIAVARRSGLTGRSSRGRIFWQGLSEGQVAGGTLVAGVGAAIVEAIEEFDAVAIALDYVPVIVSRYTAGAPRIVALTYELLTWLVVDQVVDTRRSRKIGNGG